MLSFDIFFDLRLNKRLSKQSWGWWFETLSYSLRRHCNVTLACHKPLKQWQHSFQMKSALPLVKRFPTSLDQCVNAVPSSYGGEYCTQCVILYFNCFCFCCCCCLFVCLFTFFSFSEYSKSFTNNLCEMRTHSSVLCLKYVAFSIVWSS